MIRLFPVALTLALLVLAPAATLAQEDRLGVPGPLRFSGTSYGLAWTAEPQAGYVKQEYLPAGETLETFESMILVEFLEGATNPAALASAQVDMIQARQASDPIANYDILVNESENEVILDFLLSGQGAGGEQVAEWSAYRYRAGRTASGETGVWLLGISRRGYGDEVTTFLEGLRTARGDDVSALAAMPRLLE